MAKDITDVMRDALTQAVHDVTKSVGIDGKRKSRGNPLSGAGGVAAGAGLAALAPLAAKGAVRMARRKLIGDGAGKAAGGAAEGAGRAGEAAGQGGGLVGAATHKLGDAVGHGVGDRVKQTVEEAGGVGDVAKRAGAGALSSLGGGGGGGSGQGVPGVGKGRRMPVQQSMDVAVPIETVYNQWTQFEEWPQFMHRVTRVTQDDPCRVSFATKIWAKTKEFTAAIETQRPEERIKWRVEQGITHTGVVTFHELAPRLTRVELSVDVDPGSLLEKAVRGMRHIKRAMRADMHRFKAYIEMQEIETGAWRGVIEDGELVEDHDPAYDEERDYASGDGGGSSEGGRGRADEDEDESDGAGPTAEEEDESGDAGPTAEEEGEDEDEAGGEPTAAAGDEGDEGEEAAPARGRGAGQRRPPAGDRRRSPGRRSEAPSSGARRRAPAGRRS